MTREEVRAFVRRDWAAVADAKTTFWAERKLAMAAADSLATGEMLRQHVLRFAPDWPDSAERAVDLAHHTRLSEALRAVPAHRSR